jgi:hypothetical protein
LPLLPFCALSLPNLLLLLALRLGLGLGLDHLRRELTQGLRKYHYRFRSARLAIDKELPGCNFLPIHNLIRAFILIDDCALQFKTGK